MRWSGVWLEAKKKNKKGEYLQPWLCVYCGSLLLYFVFVFTYYSFIATIDCVKNTDHNSLVIRWNRPWLVEISSTSTRKSSGLILLIQHLICISYCRRSAQKRLLVSVVVGGFSVMIVIGVVVSIFVLRLTIKDVKVGSLAIGGILTSIINAIVIQVQ